SPQDFTDEAHCSLAMHYWHYQRDEGEPVFTELLATLEDEEIKRLAVQLIEEIGAVDVGTTLKAALLYMQESRELDDARKLLAELRRTSEQRHLPQTPDQNDSEVD